MTNRIHSRGPAPEATPDRVTVNDRARFERIIRTTRWVELIGVAASASITIILERLIPTAKSLPAISGIDRVSYVWVMGLCIVMAIINTVAEMTGRQSLLTRSTFSGLALDLVFVTGVAAWTGGLQSPYYGLYFLIIIGAALWYGRNGAVYTSLIAGFCLIFAEVFDLHQLVSRHLLDLYALFSAPELFSRVPYLLLVAWLTGTAADAFRRETDRRVQAERESTMLQAEQDRIAQDLDAARRVQESLLPSSVPAIPGLGFAVRYRPIGVVGGDLYDFPSLPSGQGLVLADVSGHSLPAALLVAAARGALYDSLYLPPARLMAQVNKRLLRDTAGDRFVTMVFARVDPHRRVLQWVNAGHPSPILLRPGAAPEVLAGNGVVLGIVDNLHYHEQTRQLQPGDVLLLYSDGLVERESSEGAVTGYPDFVNSLRHVSPQESPEAIAEAVLACADRLGRVRDDVALIVVKVRVEPEVPAQTMMETA